MVHREAVAAGCEGGWLHGFGADEGKGVGRRASLTDLAVDILENPDPRTRDEALRWAALSPSIHRELWEKYGNAPPSDVNLKWMLTRERGFTETGAAEFIRVYKDTVAYAQLDSTVAVLPQSAVQEDRDDDDGDDPGPEEPDLSPPSHNRGLVSLRLGRRRMQFRSSTVGRSSSRASSRCPRMTGISS
jgi:hypothetical protein